MPKLVILTHLSDILRVVRGRILFRDKLLIWIVEFIVARYE
jgi:hypothetical protein